MDRYDKFLKRVGLVQNQVAREKLAEEKKSKLKKKRIQQQNAQRFAEYQQILRAELEARIFANVSSTGGGVGTLPFAFGNALEFDGVNDNVTFTNINVSGTTNCSFGFWFKMKTYGSDVMWGSSSSVIVNFPRVVGVTTMRVGNESSGFFDFTTPTINDAAWHYVTITKSGTTYRLYFDGTESTDGAQTISGTINLNRTGTTFGYFDGFYDEAAFWNATLTAGQVANQYNGGSGNYADLDVTPIMWWKLNESGTDTTAVNSGSSGATYDGTLNNFPASGMWVAH